MSDEYAVRFESIENRLHTLEEESRRNQAFRQEYYKDHQERIIFETQINGTINGIDEKLDKLIDWQENQIAKPGKRLDSLWEKIVLTIVGAIVGAILARVLPL